MSRLAPPTYVAYEDPSPWAPGYPVVVAVKAAPDSAPRVIGRHPDLASGLAAARILERALADDLEAISGFAAFMSLHAPFGVGTAPSDGRTPGRPQPGSPLGDR